MLRRLNLRALWPHHLLCTIGLLLALVLMDGRRVENVYIDDVKAALPYSKTPDSSPSQHHYTFDIVQPHFVSKQWYIVPDDYIVSMLVNGQSVDLTESQRGNWQRGFAIDLSPYVTHGINKVEMHIKDTGGAYGLEFSPAIFGFCVYLSFIALAVAALWSYALKLGRVENSTIIVSTLAAFCWVFAMATTTATDRAPDGWGHIEYIRYVAEHFSIPNPAAGWQYYHPPLYYFIAGSIYKTAAWAGLDALFITRFFSLICMLIFQFFGLKYIGTVIDHVRVRFYTVTILSFAPLMLALSGRLNCEIMLYALWAAFYYYLLLWFTTLRTRYLAYCVALCGVGMLTKTSAIVMVFTLCCTGAWWWWKKQIQFRKLATRSMVCLSILLLCATISNVARTAYHANDNASTDFLVSNHTADPMASAGFVGNKPENFYIPDRYFLFDVPYFSYWDQESGRRNFWVGYIKSLSFGDFNWSHGLFVGAINMLTAASMIGFLIGGTYLFLTRHYQSRWIVLLISVATTFAAHLAFRLHYEFIVTQDARYTYPVIIPYVAGLGYITQQVIRTAPCFIIRDAFNLLVMLLALAYATFSIYYVVG
jgi:hypothetical protein